MLVPSLNTLGMPDWSLKQLVQFCQAHQVEYVEIRGLRNTLDLLSMGEFNNPAEIDQTRALLQQYNVRILSFNLSQRLVDFMPEKADEIRRYAEMAQQFNVPFLRFFAGGTLNSSSELDALIDKANQVVDILSAYPVTALVETHDTLTHSQDIVELVEGTEKRLGVLWDVAHTMNLGGEDWHETYAQLQPYTRYLHVKDGHRQNGEIRYTMLLEGDLPMRELLVFLKNQPRPVIVSFEWEKLWHPDLAPGDVAAEDFLKKIRNL